MPEKFRSIPPQEIVSERSIPDLNFVLTAWGCTGCKLRLKNGNDNRYFGEALKNFRQHVIESHGVASSVQITWIYTQGVQPKEPEKKFQHSWHSPYSI